MKMSGTGITGKLELRVIKYRVKTELALNWTKSTSGNWYASDRGADSDFYDAEIDMHGIEGTMDAILDAIEANRQAGSDVLLLDEFNLVDDQIFGADVDYSAGVNCTVLEMDAREQKSWRGFGISMRLRALSPSFTGSATLPALSYVSRGYEGDGSFTVKKIDTYENSFTYVDEEYDVGTWTGTVLLTTANMKNLRRFQATQRGTSFSLTDIAGVAKPFGPRRDSGYPYTVKLIKLEDRGMRGEGYWLARLTFAEQVSET